MCKRFSNLFDKIIFILCTISVLSSRAARNSSRRLNVVFVIFDDLRPAIGAYGDKLAKTPHLDEFINDSFVFTKTYSQQSLCAPSRNSLLTSRRPDTLHLYDFYSYWRTTSGNFSTLPQYFKSHGYYTYSVGKIFHPGVSSNNSDDYPLSWSVQPFHPRTERFMNSPVCPDKMGMLRKNLICPVELQTQPYKTLPDIESVNEAIRFVNSRTMTSNPYFLALGFHKPHINFRFPKEYLNRFRLRHFFNYTSDTYKPLDMPNVAWNPYTDVRSRDDFKNMNISFPYGPISRLQSAQIRQAYYASVSYVDELFGKFMANIDRDRTIVVVTSDHGWSLGEHAEWAKYSNFEVALRVPLAIRTPEIPIQGRVQKINAITELVDIFPTLADLAHLPSLSKCNHTIPMREQITCTEGKSLYPFMVGLESEFETYALSQYPRPGTQPTKHPNSDKPKLKNIKIMGYSLRSPIYRYTLWVQFNPNDFSGDWTNIYGEEMYDHRLDGNEEVNLVDLPEFKEIRMKLRAKLIQAFS